eukprot:COSAG01_NODE_54333_length_332_cov_3.356223_1_plen_48_part_10
MLSWRLLLLTACCLAGLRRGVGASPAAVTGGDLAGHSGRTMSAAQAEH